MLDPDVFPWTQPLAENWEAIRDEALELMGEDVPALRDISPDHRRLDKKRRWKTFFLWGYGYRSDENCARAPGTAALVDAVPGIFSALFSIHAPGTHLRRHRGVTKGIVTCHLGLVIPKGEGCRIAVEDEEYRWTPGRWFIFDDTRYHEVWNDTPEERVILLLHVRRPLRGPGKWLDSAFMGLIRISPFVQEARRNLTVRGKR